MLPIVVWQVRALGTKLASDGKPHAASRTAMPEANRVGFEWHTDGTGVTCLMCTEAPCDGSRVTHFASGYEAYACLSADLKALATSLNGEFGPKYTMEDSVAEMWRRGHRVSDDGVLRVADIMPESLSEAEREMRESTPNKRRWVIYQGTVAKRHPETRQLSIFTVPTLLERFTGRGYEESKELMGAMYRPGIAPPKVYTHRWQRGDVVLWDNRCMMHSTAPFCEQSHLLLQVFARTRAPMLPPSAPVEEAHTAFVWVWALVVLVRTWTQLAASPLVQLLWLTVCLAIAKPYEPLALGVALGARLALILSGLPAQYDSQLWTLLCDSAWALHLGALLCARRTKAACTDTGGYRTSVEPAAYCTFTARLSTDEQQRLLNRVLHTNIAQLGLCYFAAGFWKVNTGFLQPHTSCAPVFFSGLFTQLLPSAADPYLTVLLRMLAPWLTLAVELSIGAILLLLPFVRDYLARLRVRRFALLLLVTFHMLIALTAPPNDIAAYGVTILPRMLLLRPHAVVAVLRAFAFTPTAPQLPAVSSWLGCALVVTLASIVQQDSITVPLLVYSAGAYVCCRAAMLPLCIEEKEEALLEAVPHAAPDATQCADQVHSLLVTKAQPCMGAVHTFMLCLTFLYAFAALTLGVMDMGAPHMFSNLRVHGGSNHLIMPTGLLQNVFYESAGVYGGGVVRVEASDSAWLVDILRYPGDVTSMHSARARAMMRAAGHTGQHWHPMLFSAPAGRQHAHCEMGVADSSHPLPVRSRKLTQPFTVPAFELRRLLAAMRAFGEPFTLSYTHLPGATGDEHWRARAVGRTVTIKEKAHGVQSQCRASGPGGLRCTSSDLALLPAPHGWRYWPAKLLLNVPYAIVDVESTTDLHCYSP